MAKTTADRQLDERVAQTDLLERDGPPAPVPHRGCDGVAVPEPIGPLTEHTAAVIRRPPTAPTVDGLVAAEAAELDDADLQRSLFLLHQLHDRGVRGADPGAEWHPEVNAWWHLLAERFEHLLLDEVPLPDVVLGPVVPLLGSITRRSRPPAGWPRGSRVCDDPMHRTEVRRHPLAHARVAGAAERAGVSAPVPHPTVVAAPVRIEELATPMLIACNLTWHLALQRRMLPALLGHLAWHEMTAPADPLGGATHVLVADAYLAELAADRPLAVWGAEVTALVEAMVVAETTTAR